MPQQAGATGKKNCLERSVGLPENHILSEEMEKKRVRILVSQERFSGLEESLLFCLFFVTVWAAWFWWGWGGD